MAERVGKAGARLGAVVELQGGILSHVYYTLKRTGVNVAVRNPPSFALRPATFNKLVRDKIPSVVAAGWRTRKDLTPHHRSNSQRL